jgi:hypothetical protein
MGTARLSAQDGTATGNLCLCGLGATNTNTSHSGETFIERCVIDVRTRGARIPAAMDAYVSAAPVVGVAPEWPFCSAPGGLAREG